MAGAGGRTDVVNRCPEFAFKLAFLLHSLLAPRPPLVLVLRHARRPTSHDSSAAAKRIRLTGMVSGITLSSLFHCSLCVCEVTSELHDKRSSALKWLFFRSEHIKNSKERLLLYYDIDNTMQIFGEIPFFGPQNET